jgi:enterobacteria phage integrase
VLEQARHNHVTILVTEYGKPFTVDGFSGFLRDAIKAAGLPLDAQPHGLRKAAGRRLAESGCSTRQIMSILGHKSLAEAERYTRDADQIRLATDAITQLEGRTGNEDRPNGPRWFGHVAK